jgi:glutathione S-transferase
MKIYYSPFSYNSKKAIMTARQLGHSPQLVKIDLAKGEQRAPELLALNPHGKVPVLVDEDFVLSESQAIMAYLADKTSGHGLYPRELHARADVNRWLFWSSNHWGPSISMINWERVVKKFLGQGDADPAQLARGEGMFHGFAKVLDTHLASREWVSSSELTLADIAIACPLMVAVPSQLPLPTYPNIEKWFARVQQLDSWKQSAS